MSDTEAPIKKRGRPGKAVESSKEKPVVKDVKNVSTRKKHLNLYFSTK